MQLDQDEAGSKRSASGMRPLGESDSKPSTAAAQGLLIGGSAAVAGFHLVLFLGILIYGVTLGAPSEEERAVRNAAEQADEQSGVGQRIFEQRCASCHGIDGEGIIGPGFAGVTSRFPNAADQADIVRAGRDKMPAFGGTLSSEEIDAVVAYEREALG